MYYYNIFVVCILMLALMLNSLMSQNCPGVPIKYPCKYAELVNGCQIVCDGYSPMNITDIFSDLSRKLPSNKKLFLLLGIANKAIEELPANAFADIQFTNIYFAHANNLRVINAGAFIGTQDTVIDFDIYDTPINDHDGSGLFAAIRSLSGLRHLTLSATAIDSLPGNAFAGLDQLSSLNLLSNPIQAIHTNAFAELGHLHWLYITASPIVRVAEKAFNFGYPGTHTNMVLSDIVALGSENIWATGALDSIGRPINLWLNGDGVRHLDERVFGSFLAASPDNTVHDSEFDCADSRNQWIKDKYPKVWNELCA